MMRELIEAFPENLTEGLNIAKAQEFKKPVHQINNIVICGMGGSGIGGSLVQSWLRDELKIPVVIVKEYTIPAFVNENSLVIASSYSGNTEETLSAIEQAIERGAHIIGITSGGKLEDLGNALGFDTVIVPGGNPPRTALAFSLIQLINIFEKLGFIAAGKLNEFDTSKNLLLDEKENIHALAKELAAFLKDRVGVLYGTSEYEAVLIRARQQFNENSKQLCLHHALPEMNHNELVGWGGGDNRFAVVTFEDEDIHPRNKKRFAITKERIQAKTDRLMTINAKGASLIEKSLYFINIVDWASLYLAEMREVDPIDIEVIDFLKGELAKF